MLSSLLTCCCVRGWLRVSQIDTKMQARKLAQHSAAGRSVHARVPVCPVTCVTLRSVENKSKGTCTWAQTSGQ